MARASPRMPAPEPPRASGMQRPRRPASRKASKMSVGYSPVLSISRARGLTLSRARRRTLWRSSSSSGAKSKSIGRTILARSTRARGRERRRVRAQADLRRCRTIRRRSRSVVPPQTPSRSREPRACSRQRRSRHRDPGRRHACATWWHSWETSSSRRYMVSSADRPATRGGVGRNRPNGNYGPRPASCKGQTPGEGQKTSW